MSKLAYALMHNPHVLDPHASPEKQTHRGAPSPGDQGDRDHTLRQISKEHQIVKKSPQLRCVCCNKKTSWYCVGCTTGLYDICPVCPSETRGGDKGGEVTKQHVCECA